MADRVHPIPTSTSPPPSSPPPASPSQEKETETTPLHPSFHRPPPPAPGDYIVQIPKDQILRVPPPDHARKYASLRRRPARRRFLRRLCCAGTAALLLLLLAAAAFVAIVYLVFRPRFPSYSLSSLSARNLDGAVNLTAVNPLSPEFDAAVKADNSANRHVAVVYLAGGEVSVSYDGVLLANGAWPPFHQPPKNVTTFLTALRGEGVNLTEEQRKKLATEQKGGAVPLTVDVRVPVKAKFGKMTTWTITVKARCDVTVDKLTATAKVLSKECKVKAKVLWWWW